MLSLIAQKSGMSQIILDNGEVASVTLLKLEPNVVVQVKTDEKEGYSAIQLGAGIKKRYNKPEKQHLKELDASILRESRVTDSSKYKRGDKLDLSLFEVNELVSVVGISKGKGFAGTIKRHNFRSGPGGHGHDHHRQPGSIGAMGMSWVHKGKRMAGRMGNDKITTKNLKIVSIDKQNNVIALRGSVPGANKGWVLINKLNDGKNN